MATIENISIRGDHAAKIQTGDCRQTYMNGKPKQKLVHLLGQCLALEFGTDS
jgi:hypothetical protein